MVQYIPGPESTLGPAFQQIAEGITKFFKPNLAFQMQMRDTLARNPQLIQHLADVEALAPGTLQNLGFGALGGIIQQTPESPAANVARTERATIGDTQRQQVQGEALKTKLDITKLQTATKILGDPEQAQVAKDAALQLLTGQTEAQRETATAGAQTAKVKATEAEAELPANLKKTALEGRVLDEALKTLPDDLKGVNFRQLARQFARGELDGATLTSIYMTPGMHQAFEAARHDEMFAQTQALQRWLASFREGDKDDNTLTQQAFRLYSESNAGTLDAWRTLIGPGGRKKALSLSAKPVESLTQDERDLVDAYKAEQELQANEIRKRNQGFSQVINEAVNRINTARQRDEPESVIQTHVQNLQQELNAKAAITGRQVTAHYGKVPDIGANEQGFFDFNGKGLYFTDDSGKRVDEAEIYGNIRVNSDSEMRRQAAQLVGEIAGFDADTKAAALKRIEQNNPAVYALVISMMGVGNKNRTITRVPARKK